MSDVTAGLVETAARALVMAQTNGLCNEWPKACADCDCFRDESPTLSGNLDRAQARAVLAAVLPGLAEYLDERAGSVGDVVEQLRSLAEGLGE